MEKCRTLGVIIFITISLCLRTCLSQQAAAPAPASSVLPKDACNGVFLSYNYIGGNRIPPINATNQAYRFTSTVTVLNNWVDELKSWRVFVGFQHKELLVSATNAVLADGSSLPASVGNGTTLVGFPQTDLKSAIETAGDVNQMEAIVQLVGTQFGIASPDVPLPSRLSLDNDGYSCPAPTLIPQGNELYVCCIRNSNISLNGVVGDNFQPREDGDLIIMYDVIRAYSTDYWAQVSISNHDNLGRLDNWQLSWKWMRGEFIYAMRGARPLVADVRDCIFGDQGRHYRDLDFSQALSCKRIPTIIDLPPARANDTDIGGIPFCCRNGTILPPIMDVTKSKSVFQMHVYKMPPDLNMSGLYAPQNWKINGTFSSDYQCGNPVPVSPSEFPDPTGLPSETAAIASWQVVCNITKLKDERPKCCVSFSAFYNDSVVPCSTCACGCNNNPSQTCSASEPAILLPSSALLLPFENRTELALNWAEMKRISVPNPLPCGDNCGVSINWHILSDYRGGWTARITLFNWGETNLADWSAAVELDKAVPGFEKVYSFNGTVLPDSNNTIFMRGLLDFNYLLAEREGKNPKKDPRVPGLQQSVISFTKKNTPGINVPGGDGFPTKVFFNGEECALPTIRPSNGYKIRPAASPLGLLMILALFWIRL